ncbi:Nitrous oxide reductase maturation protein NosD [Paenibacillus pasadenensis]|uniref:Nitrous oxide reductase maturation protein NosD n=1 Tax=Paenibacillus pasadenensis TaxID=217090 RepID=A0A2N5N9I5_9BACL|nr:NosD domain-containing protein [Paenibacillus pasadenensis]PLT47017.1 Nitrous oxide reductase maturation protein NosD [Paenibacillus pasadenensis]
MIGKIAYRLALAAVLAVGAGAAGPIPASEAAQAEAGALQKLIDEAPHGSTVVLPAGDYDGELVVDKPLVVQGEGVTLHSGVADTPAVAVRADFASISGLSIVKDSGGEAAAVLVEGDGVRVEGLRIVTRTIGIQLQESDGTVIRNNAVEATPELLGRSARASERRNGIDLYRSHGNTIENNRVSSMFDGIYLEGSNNTAVRGNVVDFSRYGVHLMYTKNTDVEGNRGSHNVTGIMAMVSRGGTIAGNAFKLQKGSVNSQGMLFYEVEDMQVTGNELVGNRVGLYIERSANNVWTGNDVSYNFVGIQLLDSADNELAGNRFVSNVIETMADGSAGNRIEGNYWDAFQGLDPNGDGKSDLAYPMNPFFQRLTKDTPAFQLFFQSPGMKFLEGLMAADSADWTRDRAPLMKQPVLAGAADSAAPAAGGATAAAGAALLLAASTIIILGVRKR